MIKPEYLSEKIRKFAYKYPIYVFHSSIRTISKKDRVIKREIKISFSCKTQINKSICTTISLCVLVIRFIHITKRHRFDYKNIRY